MQRLVLIFSVLFLLTACRATKKNDVPPLDSGTDTVDAGRDGGQTEPCGGACAGDTPFCNETTNECVECLGPDDCTGDAALCHENTCVECVDTIDCESPEASVCDVETKTCVGCETNDDCVHIEGDLGVCEAGTCVQCTPGTEETKCGVRSCNPLTFSCSEFTRDSQGACDPCVSDSDCAGDNAGCVPLDFMGEDRGGYCLEREPDSGLCPNRFVTVIMRRTLSTPSDGEAEAFCGIDERNVTCEAIDELGTTCDEADEEPCMADGSSCKAVSGLGMVCTYSCGVEQECPVAGPTASCEAGYCGS